MDALKHLIKSILTYIFLREPTIVAMLFRQSLAALASFKLELTKEQSYQLGVTVELVTVVINRALVSPAFAGPPSSGSGTAPKTRMYLEGSGKTPSDPPSMVQFAEDIDVRREGTHRILTTDKAILLHQPTDGLLVWLQSGALKLRSGSGTMLAFLLLTIAPLTGCAGSLESAKKEGVAARRVGATSEAQADKDYCRDVDNARGWGGLGAKTTGFLGGASGLGSLAVSDDSQLRDALVISAAGAAAISLGLVVWTENRDAAWARECSQ